MRRRGRLGSVGAAVGDLASAVRRARASRSIYVRAYDATGRGRTLDPASGEAKAALEAANRLLEGPAEARKMHENASEGL